MNEKKEIIRPWLSIVLDDFSRVISGYYLSENTPDAIHTALALRQAIWRKIDKVGQSAGFLKNFILITVEISFQSIFYKFV